MKSIAIANQKGGVGKTSLCLHTAGALAEAGQSVLLVDMDQQGDLSSVFIDHIYTLPRTVVDLLTENPEVTPAEVIQPTQIDKINILPANLYLGDLDERLAGNFDAEFYLYEALQEVRDTYDFVLIDCPPHLGRATRMAMIAASVVLIPLECQEWATVGTKRMLAYIDRVKKRANPQLELMGFVINKLKTRRTLEEEFRQVLRAEYGSKVFQTEFRDNVQFAEAAAARMPITHYQPNSEQADLYRSFIKEVLCYAEKTTVS